jgi:hypothetical protein
LTAILDARKLAGMQTELAHATRILVVGGVANLVLSFLLGWLLSAKRMKEPIDKHHWLLVAHEVSLQEGLMLLGLAFALGFAKLSPGVANAGAWMLVAGSVFQDASGILNWLTATGDQFEARGPGWIAATVNAVLNTAGLGIVAWGVARGIL